jgi:hypothetical protein
MSVNRVKIMEKIKLIQTIQVNDENVSYLEILNNVNNLKEKTQTQLKESNLEDKFEVVVEVINSRNSIELKTT